MKTLLVDDEPEVLEGICTLVDWQRLGMELTGTARDGLEGAAMAKALQPDIVLTDIRMPGQDGLALIREVQQTLPEAVFIVMSGFSEFAYARTALSLGVLDYLEKPVTLEDVENAMEKARQRVLRQRPVRELQLPAEKPAAAVVCMPVSRHRGIARVCSYLEENFQKDISLQEVADYAGMNTSYLSELFKVETGMSYIRYLTTLRMEKACRLLEAGEKAARVGTRVGYHSQRHFTDIFRRYTGVTPGDFRTGGHPKKQP